jgi:LysR family transcriptional regulator of beta-lactamase
VMVEAAMQGAGVALAPSMMFARDLEQGRLVRPFSLEVGSGMYWLTWLKSRTVTPALGAFRDWLAEQAV